MKAPALICLMGTECTGKTTLAQTLARHFEGLWVPEYLRTFCDLHGRTPRPEEQALIVQTQLDHEAQAITQARQKGCMHVFCDTAPLLTAIYSDYIFADRTLYARARALHTRYALTLALAPDLPWQADGLQREGAHVRAPIQVLLERELLGLSGPVRYITGTGAARAQAAIKAVQNVAEAAQGMQDLL